MKHSFQTILALITAFSIISCLDLNTENNLDSDRFSTKTERIAVLKKEIKPYSEFHDAAFELFNVNGFSDSRSSVPGASSFDYKFAIKIKASDIDKWTQGFSVFKPQSIDTAWINKIVEKQKDQWSTQGKPEFYKRPNDDVMVIVYRDEGILFKRVRGN